MSGRWKVFVVVVLLVGVSAMGAFSTGRGAIGTQIADNAAKDLRGGACSLLDQQAQGACTTNQGWSCYLYILGCSGFCPFQCSPTSRMVSGSTSWGTIVSQGACATVIEPACTFVWVPGLPPVPDCACVGGANTYCGVPPTGCAPCGV